MRTEETPTHSQTRAGAGEPRPGAECGAATEEADRGGVAYDDL